MRKILKPLLILPLLMLLVSLACQLSGGPTPQRVVNISPEQAQSVLTPDNTIKTEPTTGKVTVQMTEAQATSYLVYNFRDRYESVLRDPVILFQDGRAEIYGTIYSESISASGMVSISVKINDQGNPSVSINQANFGQIPIPPGLLANLSKVIDQLLRDATQQYQKNYQLESITFSPGVATITLRPR